MIPTTPAQDQYTRFSCPNPACAQFNRPGAGNIAHRAWTGKHQHDRTAAVHGLYPRVLGAGRHLDGPHQVARSDRGAAAEVSAVGRL